MSDSFSIAFDLKSKKCAWQGVHHLFQHFGSMGPYGAHHAPKKGYTPVLELYLACVIILQQSVVSQVSVSKEAWAHMELTMLLKYIKAPVLSVPLTFLSH